jgi:hypothetical protein
MHCSVSHWQQLDDKNWIDAAGWLLTLARGGEEEFRRVVQSMREGARPVEQSALVVMGAAFPKDLKIRTFLKSRAFGAFSSDIVSASIYGLAAHLDFDEHLRDRLLVQSLKWKAFSDFEKVVQAVSEVFFIWDTSKGSGTCISCGMTPTSPSTLKRLG